MNLSANVRAPGQRTLFGHPLGLTILGMVNMWEAFALFGMRTVLVYYLVDDVHVGEARAIQIYSFSVGFAFAMSLVGGYFADRWLHRKVAIAVGGLLMATGSFVLGALGLLYPGLVLSAVGYGLFRPTLTAEVGLLYESNDPHLDGGYTIFSMVSNAGGILAPFVCGTIGEVYGWSWAFIISGAGMVIALVIFAAGHKTLCSDETPSPTRPRFQWAQLRKLPVALIMVWAGAALVWTAYNQVGGAVALWAQEHLDRSVGFATLQFTIPVTWFQAVNPILIVVLSPVAARILDRRPRGGTTSDANRMALGALLIGLFAIVLLGSALAAGQGARSPWWNLIAALLPLTVGELLFSPAGQAMFSRVAPFRDASFVMSFWFLTIMAGYFGAGWLAKMWNTWTIPSFFAVTAATALLGAGFFLLANMLAHRLRQQ